MDSPAAPTLEAIRANRARLGDLVVTTSVRLCRVLGAEVEFVDNPHEDFARMKGVACAVKPMSPQTATVRSSLKGRTD